MSQVRLYGSYTHNGDVYGPGLTQLPADQKLQLEILKQDAVYKKERLIEAREATSLFPAGHPLAEIIDQAIETELTAPVAGGPASTKSVINRATSSRPTVPPLTNDADDDDDELDDEDGDDDGEDSDDDDGDDEETPIVTAAGTRVNR